jgi:hypothetical protein
MDQLGFQDAFARTPFNLWLEENIKDAHECTVLRHVASRRAANASFAESVTAGRSFIRRNVKKLKSILGKGAKRIRLNKLAIWVSFAIQIVRIIEDTKAEIVFKTGSMRDDRRTVAVFVMKRSAIKQ